MQARHASVGVLSVLLVLVGACSGEEDQEDRGARGGKADDVGGCAIGDSACLQGEWMEVVERIAAKRALYAQKSDKRVMFYLAAELAYRHDAERAGMGFGTHPNWFLEAGRSIIGVDMSAMDVLDNWLEETNRWGAPLDPAAQQELRMLIEPGVANEIRDAIEVGVTPDVGLTKGWAEAYIHLMNEPTTPFEDLAIMNAVRLLHDNPVGFAPLFPEDAPDVYFAEWKSEEDVILNEVGTKLGLYILTFGGFEPTFTAWLTANVTTESMRAGLLQLQIASWDFAEKLSVTDKAAWNMDYSEVEAAALGAPQLQPPVPDEVRTAVAHLRSFRGEWADPNWVP
jgi:hypothetical protein